ncbi:MAG: PKD domain-containing protein, partial [Chloroflexi bacterium]|nr:PKD domain-containing protein [Chloroflexota bacterium]
AEPAAINVNDSTTVSGSFNDPGTLDSNTVAIDWGDGSPVTTLNLAANVLTFSASHKYLDNKAANAPYTVSATVTDKDGAYASASSTLTVNNVPPTATLEAPSRVARGSSFSISLTSPADPGTADVAAGFNYAFDFGSGYGAFGRSNSASGAAAVVGNQTVRGKIQDKDGGVTEYSATVTVYNNLPVATVSLNNTSPRTNDILTASATKSDADNDPVTLTFVWKVNGVAKKTTPAPTALTDTFDLSVAGNGDKGDAITVEAIPNDGLDNGAAASASTTVVNSPVIARFGFTLSHTRPGKSNPPTEGGRIQFKDLSYDPDGGDSIASWQWGINGPTSGPHANAINQTSQGQNPYFYPPDNGVYTASLTITGSDGTSTTVTSPTQTPTVTGPGGMILARRLLVGNTPPKVNALNIEVRAGDDVTLLGRFLDHGWLDTHTATWTVQGVSVPIPATVREDHKPVLGTGIVTGLVTGADLSNALVSLGRTTLPATLSGSLTVADNDGSSRTGYRAARTDTFTITVVADNPNSREPNNDFTVSPPILLSDSIFTSYIGAGNDIDIFEIKRPDGTLPAGSQVLVTLKGLPADYDLALLARLPVAVAGTGGQSQFGAAYFDLSNFRISGYDDGGYDDGGYDDGGYDDGGYDDGGYDDGGYDDGGYDDGGYDDGGYDDGGYDDGAFDRTFFENSSLSAMSFTGLSGTSIGGTDLQVSEVGLSGILTADVAPYMKVAGFSANRGVRDEVLLTRIGLPGTRLFAVIIGSNGARSAKPYQLQIESSAPVARPITGSPLVVPATPQTLLRQDSAPKTLFVTQQDRLKALNKDYTAWDTFVSRLSALAAHDAVRGEIVSLPSGIYDNWDTFPASVDEANNVAVQIRNIVQGYLRSKPTIQNVVIVGSDDVVPHRRVPDETVIGNERYYLRSSYLKLGSPLFSSVMLGYILTDDYYVSGKPMAWQGRELYIPDVPTGRLVETPQEMIAAADAFLAVNGILSPRTAFVSGYEGFTDGAQTMAANLASGGLGVSTLLGATWSAADLRSRMLGQLPSDILIPNAHFTHYAALSAAGFNAKQNDIMSSVQVQQAVGALVNRILSTLGCHSGLSVPDRASRAADPGLGVDPKLDFPQVMAQQRTVYIGNTGYGLFETEGLGGTELLLTILAKGLVQGDVTVGNALVASKQQYLGNTSPITAYEEKSAIQTTLYNLPMYRVVTNIPSAPAPAPSGGIAGALSVTDGGAVTTTPYVLQQVSTPTGSYYNANGDSQSTAGRPVEPRIVRPIASDATRGAVHGILLLGGAYSDTPGFDPVISRPTNQWERNVTEPQTAFSSFWPSQTATINGLDTARGLLQTLVVNPGQFKATSAPGATVTGIQRLYTSLSFEMVRSNLSDWQPPLIRGVDFRAVNDTTVAVTVDATDPGGIARIVILRISNGGFSPTSLVLSAPPPASGPFTLNVPFTNGDTLLVQVVDAAGNVASATGKGATFSVIKVDASADQVGAPGQPVVLRANITGFDALSKPVSFLWDFGDGTFLDGQATGATFTVQHTYAAAVTQATATLKVSDAGGGVGVDKVLLIWDASGDVGTVSANGDLVGGGAWIDSSSMTIVLRVAGQIDDEFQYRVRIETAAGSAHLRYDRGKTTGLSSLTGSAAGNQVTFRFNLAELGLRSGDTVQLYAETQSGVQGTPGVGFSDRMPDSGAVTYVLY